MQSNKEKAFWTKRRDSRAERDLKVFLTYHEMIMAGGMSMPIREKLAEEYGIGVVTVDNIRRRVPGRLKELIERYPKYRTRADKYLQTEGVTA